MAILKDSHRLTGSFGRNFSALARHRPFVPVLTYQARSPMLPGTSENVVSPMMGSIHFARRSIFTLSARLTFPVGRNRMADFETIHSSAAVSTYPHKSPSESSTSVNMPAWQFHGALPIIVRAIFAISARLVGSFNRYSDSVFLHCMIPRFARETAYG